MFNPNHKHCFSKPPERDTLRQATLSLSPAGLGFVVPKAKPYPRTPMPNRIRRTTHTPFFSTDDRSLCSFLRLPYEIRRLIYEELLYCGKMRYRICLYTSRLTMTSYYTHPRRYPYMRHGIYPAILECCHQINGEGSQVLYGENHFGVAWCTSVHPVANSWPLTRRSMELITKLNIGYWNLLPKTHNTPMIAELAQPFANLRHIAITVQILQKDWGKFLELSAEYLSRMQSGLVMFGVDNETMDLIAERQRVRAGTNGSWTMGVDVARRVLLPYCEAVAARYMATKDIRWEFVDVSDQWDYHWSVHMAWGRRDLSYAWSRTHCRMD